jgi:hypothetical protein
VVCDELADWVDSTVRDRRGVDATIRFFGLVRLPEELPAIASGLRAHRGDDPACRDASLGLSPRQVQNLRDEAIADVAATDIPALLAQPAGCVTALADPFPGRWRGEQYLSQRALWWAWAQIPDGAAVARHALLFYEQEHGLRADGGQPQSRTQCWRWRRLAWSMMVVAAHRVAQTEGADMQTSVRVLELALGPRLLGSVEHLQVAGELGGGLDQLMWLQAAPGARIGVDELEEALDAVRNAVHSGSSGRQELLGILRDALARFRAAKGTHAIPGELTSKVLALSVILARERRNVAGISTAEASLALLERLPREAKLHRPSARLQIASDRLRIGNEIVELYDALGLYAEAWRALERWRRILDAVGDPDHDVEPGGWSQQWHLAAASVAQHMARVDSKPNRWLEAATEYASRASDPTPHLPLPWLLAARNQRITAQLHIIERTPDARGNPNPRLLLAVMKELEEVHSAWTAVPNFERLDNRSARLGAFATAWRAALVSRDPSAVEAARAAALAAGGAWVLPRDLDELASLERRSVAAGFMPNAPIGLAEGKAASRPLPSKPPGLPPGRRPSSLRSRRSQSAA